MVLESCPSHPGINYHTGRNFYPADQIFFRFFPYHFPICFCRSGSAVLRNRASDPPLRRLPTSPDLVGYRAYCVQRYYRAADHPAIHQTAAGCREKKAAFLISFLSIFMNQYISFRTLVVQGQRVFPWQMDFPHRIGRDGKSSLPFPLQSFRKFLFSYG